MKNEELVKILSKHNAWLNNCPAGKRADLTRADLTGADLTGADLTYAYLTGADLTRADLTGANLTGANLTRADLTGANIDYSSWPLHCGSLDAKIDKRLACQLLYHVIRAMQSVDDKECQRICKLESVITLANQFHRAPECGIIK